MITHILDAPERPMRTFRAERIVYLLCAAASFGLLLTAPAAAEPAPAQARRDAPIPAHAGGMRVRAATPNVDGYYIVRADIFRRLQNQSELPRAFGPRPLPDQVMTRPGFAYYLFPSCNGQVDMRQRLVIDGGARQVTLRCP